MTEPTPPDSPSPAAPPPPTGTPERARIDGPSRRSRDALPLLYLLGFLVLGGSLAYLYSNPIQTNQARESEFAALNSRVSQLENRPAPTLAPVEGRIAALEGRIAGIEARPAPPPPAPVDLGPLNSRLDAAATKEDLAVLTARLNAVLAQDLGVLSARLEAAATKEDVGVLAARLNAAVTQDLAVLSARLDAAATKEDVGALAGRLNAAITQDLAVLSTRLDAAATKENLNGLTARLNAAEERVASAEQQAKAASTQAATQLKEQVTTQIASVTEESRRLSQVQAAAAALNAGQRLGAIPGAPPALARFASEPPPTEASLRLSFDDAADAAARASQPAITEDQPFASRLWTRAQQAVTVRQGDRVLLGDPVSGVLTRAKQSVDAGDLAGAIAALTGPGGLAGSAAAAMQPWIDQARALLDARAALAQMARG